MASRPAARRLVPRAIILAIAIMVATLAVVATWWLRPPDPAAELRANHRPLLTLEREPAPGLGRGFERWRMIAMGPDTVTGLWRPSARGDTTEWVAVILGGIGTDERSALLVPDSLPIGVLAVSWPWRGPRHMGRGTFLMNLPALRAALLHTPGALARGVEAVRRRFPGARVVLIGASLGVPPVTAAISLTRPEALVLVDGAADLGPLVRSETERWLGHGLAGRVLAPPAGSLAARLLSSLEPARFGPAARGLPVLLLDAESERRYPPECVARLHAAFPRAVRATHPGGHMRPEDQRQLAAIIDTIWEWLADRDAETRAMLLRTHAPVLAMSRPGHRIRSTMTRQIPERGPFPSRNQLSAPDSAMRACSSFMALPAEMAAARIGFRARSPGAITPRRHLDRSRPDETLRHETRNLAAGACGRGVRPRDPPEKGA